MKEEEEEIKEEKEERVKGVAPPAWLGKAWKWNEKRSRLPGWL